MTTESELNEALDEIDRLRALPVIATCWACRHWERVGFPPTPACQHPETLRAHPIGYMPIDPSHTPPSWCPLRGGEVKGGDEDTKSSEPYYALGIREEAERSGRTPAEVQAEFVEWRRRKHEKGAR